MGYAGRSEKVVELYPSVEASEEAMRREMREEFLARFEYVPEVGWVGGPPMANGFATAMALGYVGLGCFATGWYVGTGLWWAATWAFFGGGL